MENTTAVGKLRETLRSIRQRSVSGRFFTSYSHLKSKLTKSLISDVITDIYISELHRSRVVANILGEGLVVLSILSWLHEEEEISHFIDHNELDRKLPMEQIQINRIAPNVSDRFCTEVQWEFLPHVFEKNAYHRKIRPEMILPFVAEQRLGEGAGGEIFKCDIEATQQDFLPREVALFPPQPP
jgi:hypothetical protein